MAYFKDPRITILLFLISFVVIGQLFLGFFQNWDDFFTSIFVALAMELLLVKLIRGTWILPLSALITGIGISLLLSSDKVWAYAVTSSLAILFKHLIRYKGRHLFNPNNLAMVLMLLFLPQFAVSTPKQWTNGYEIMTIILFLGCIAAYQAKRLDTVLSFIIGYVGFAWIRHEFFGDPFLFAFGPMLGASFQLFTFFMITDPQTTPNFRWGRIAVGLFIAFWDAALRVNDITNSLFYASFLSALLLGIPMRVIKGRKTPYIPHP